MSLHYPHRVGVIRPSTGRQRTSHVVHRYPRESDLRPRRRQGAAVLGGVLVLLVTAWLIWGALAEAALARAGAL